MSTIEKAIALSSGLMRDLYEHGMRVGLPYPEYALPSAITILSSILQRRCSFEGLKDVCTFIVLVGDASSGKSFFQSEFVASYIRQCLPQIILPPVASVNALKMALIDNPARLMIIDEIMKKWARVYRANPGDQAEALHILILELYGCLSFLLGQAKGSSSQAIDTSENPRLTIFAGTTNHGMEKMCENDEFLSDGMGSRLSYYRSREFRISAGKRVDWAPDQSLVLRLQALMKRDKFRPDAPTENESSTGTHCDMGSVGPQYILMKDSYEKKAQEAHGFDRNLGQYYRRGHERLLKYAYLHALGCDRESLTARDLSFGKALIDYEIATALEFVTTGPATHEDAILATLEAMEGDAYLTARQIYDALPNRRRWTIRDTNTLLRALCESHAIEALEESEKRAGRPSLRYRALQFGEGDIGTRDPRLQGGIPAATLLQ